MRARNHPAGEHTTPAVLICVATVIGTIAVLTHAIDFVDLDTRFLKVASVIALGCLAPSLTWKRRGSVCTIETEPGRVRIDGAMVVAQDVTGFSAVEGQYGWSVAIATGAQTAIYSVARRSDAERIAISLRQPFPRHGMVMFERPSTAWRLAQFALSITGVISSYFYWRAATGELQISDGKPFFGLSAMGIGLLGMLFFYRRTLPRVSITLRHRGVDALGQPVNRIETIPAGAHGPQRLVLFTARGTHVVQGSNAGDERMDHVIAHVSDAMAPPERVDDAGEVRVDHALTEGSENAREWLARLDASSKDDGARGYRSAIPSREELWRILRDEREQIEARMAAGRLLRVRYAESEATLIASASDPAARTRIRVAVHETAESAAETLDELGPAFRTRAETTRTPR